MTSTLHAAQPKVEDQDFIDRIIAEQGTRPGALLSILELVQDHHRHKFLPLETLEYVAMRTNVPQARVYAVATFYALFNLEPQGAHTVSICRGTACHTRGSRALLERVKLEMGFSSGPDEMGDADKLTFTTPDRQYTIRTVACFGQCALAPVVEVDHSILGHVNERALQSEIDTLRRESR
jgi:NADH-quinone oxidoreductase subunit E